MIEDILSKRQQTKGYHPLRIPDKKLAENLISKTFKLTASKQNLMPYKVHVLGPDKKELKKEFFKIVLFIHFYLPRSLGRIKNK